MSDQLNQELTAQSLAQGFAKVRTLYDTALSTGRHEVALGIAMSVLCMKKQARPSDYEELVQIFLVNSQKVVSQAEAGLEQLFNVVGLTKEDIQNVIQSLNQRAAAQNSGPATNS